MVIQDASKFNEILTKWSLFLWRDKMFLFTPPTPLRNTLQVLLQTMDSGSCLSCAHPPFKNSFTAYRILSVFNDMRLCSCTVVLPSPAWISLIKAQIYNCLQNNNHNNGYCELIPLHWFLHVRKGGWIDIFLLTVNKHLLSCKNK